jgi:hypothetical protein
MKRVIFAGMMLCALIIPASCHDDDRMVKMTVTVASVRPYPADANEGIPSCFMKSSNSESWHMVGEIRGFEYEEGFEYVLIVEYKKSPVMQTIVAIMFSCTLREAVSKERREPENIPLQGMYLTVASRKVSGNAAFLYYVKIPPDNEWILFPKIEDFDCVEGYEYRVTAGRKFNGSRAFSPFTRICMAITNKEQKISEGLPE